MSLVEGRPTLLPEELPEVPAYRAAAFDDEPAADHAYFEARDRLRSADHGFSVFDFALDDHWCVAVLNRQRRPEIDGAVQQILSVGRSITLPPDVLALLEQRTRYLVLEGQMKELPWVERDRRSA